MTKMRVLTTDELLAINRAAVQRDYNRGLNEKFEADVDPNGKHVVAFEMFHDAYDGEFRWQVLTKVRGSMEPVEVWVDVAPHLADLGEVVEVSSEGARDYSSRH